MNLFHVNILIVTFLVIAIPVFGDPSSPGDFLNNSSNLTPNLTPTPTPTFIPPILPTEEPLTTQVPTQLPTLEPTEVTTLVPASEPTPEPTLLPTEVPTQDLTPLITSESTPEPTLLPTLGPIEEPTVQPTPEPTLVPTELPTIMPPLEPTMEPSLIPTGEPTPEPVVTPVVEPLQEPIGISAEDSAYFHIESIPSGAEVIFDGIGRGPSPVNVTVSTTGVPTHNITLQLSGYQDWSETRSNPAPGETEVITATLTLLPPNGSISVTSSPTGAMVVLDGSGLQTTPFVFTDVTPGVHTIGISKDGYNPYSTPVTVTSGAQATVFAALSPVTSSGSLTVTSNPPNALILLNNIAYGVTPAHFSAIAAGTYNLQLTKPGYQTVSQPIVITPGSDTPVTVNLPRRIPVTGALTVRSQPSGGTVTLDGVVQGVTPLRITHLIPNSYNLRVSFPGYLSWIGIVHIIAGGETSIFASIGPVQPVSYSGSLSVQSEPSGATVSIDSIPLGKTPLFIQNVAAGSHTLHFEYPGYLPYSTSVLVSPARTSYITSVLTKQPIINLSSTLITLSDDAAIYFKSHGLADTLRTFNDPNGGFIRDRMFVVAWDLNGTILADGGNTTLIGVNLSDISDVGGLSTGTLMSGLSSIGGGLFYDTYLTGGDPAQVSLVYVRPAINGVIIGTVIPVPEIRFPASDLKTAELKNAVHAAVIHARENGWQTIDTSDSLFSSIIQPGISLYPFDRTVTEDKDIYGVRQSQVMTAATTGKGGYFWLLNRGEPDIISVTPGYAEAVDSRWGIWAVAKPGSNDVIAMVDMNMIKV